jgi:hypothetical protein
VTPDRGEGEAGGEKDDELEVAATFHGEGRKSVDGIRDR